MKGIVVLHFVAVIAATYGCNSRDYGNGATVCVCSGNNCDTIPSVTPLTAGQYVMFTSSKAGSRFQKTSGTFMTNSTSNYNNETIFINRQNKYQKIFGFGGAFTDAAGINILSLTNQTRDTLMRAYYSDDGVQYSMGRVPIGGTDFSTRGYTYDDVGDDFTLKFFSLQVEDVNYKIPLIKEAMNLTNYDFKLFASAWTAPAWMKTNDKLIGVGFLNLTMYDLWAQYHVKFLDAYRENNILFWGLTTGNEPANGFTPMMQINDMGWEPGMQAEWIVQYLGPKLKLNQYYQGVKIMLIDDQRVFYPWIPRYMFLNQLLPPYVDGFAVHYYTDKYVPAEVLSITHYDFPDKFIFSSEACEGSFAQQQVILGSWDRAENYLHSIFDDLNNWSTGWMDWNIALNLDGGPTYVGNYVDSPIIVNKTADEFYKQPTYYALGHFAKYIRPDSQRIQSTYSGTSLKEVVFQRPDGGIVVSIFNPTDNDINVTVVDKTSTLPLSITIPSHSVNSVLYW